MLINGKNVYDMSRFASNYKGYFMDKDGEIYSTKRVTGGMVRMLGSNTASGRYYTLNGMSYSHARLVREIQSQKDFKAEMQSPQVSSADQRAHAESTQAGLDAKGYIIGKLSGDTVILGSKPKIHLTLKSVNSEMERLAQAHPGVKFIRLKIDGSVVLGGMKWE